jgi:hypothetical protein
VNDVYEREGISFVLFWWKGRGLKKEDGWIVPVDG